MCKLFDEWANEIHSYCESNGLNFDKARRLPKSWGKDNPVLQYYDEKSPHSGHGLLDETHMPVVLWIDRKSDGTLVFEQTEHTRKYFT